MSSGRKVTALVATAIAVALAVLAWHDGRPCRGDEDEKMPHKRAQLPDAATIATLPPDGGKQFNRLIHETSPYLLQHARNPVNWYPWGPEAFTAAKKANKPIFLSVGYSTCHWCHVMERESFERKDVADILNAHYIAIKVDREQRPDVDQIYMLATQMLTGRGGWPNSLWLTPDAKPWFAGTYFPREDSPGRAGFKTILTQLAQAWKTKRKDVDAQADHISTAMKKYSAAGAGAGPKTAAGDNKISRETITVRVRTMAKSFDKVNGGLGGSPKFPPHSALRLLLAEAKNDRSHDAALLKPVTHTLGAMARGGIHDHVGGGFHRYSTDERWFLPHFEKMLYDNAQLARVYVEAWVLTGDEDYRRTAEGICDWVLREMTDAGGGFHSALDADSEGEEGKFYLWQSSEIIDILGEADGKLFCDIYDVTGEGNYRDEATGQKPGTNILHLPKSLDQAAGEHKLKPAELHRRMANARAKLLAVRVKRVWPHKDDKVLTAWNALMIGSLAHAGHQLKEPRYTAAAERAADFILTRMRKQGRLLRTYRDGKASLTAYLDDYAFLAGALVDLHEATGQKRWLDEAASVADSMLKHYRDTKGGGFHFTAGDHEQLLTRLKDPFDSAIPSGNAAAAHALVRLAKLTGRKEYQHAAQQTLEAFGSLMASAPRGMPTMLLAGGEYLDAFEPDGIKADAGVQTCTDDSCPAPQTHKLPAKTTATSQAQVAPPTPAR